MVSVASYPCESVRYVLPSDDKMVQKLLLLYMEIIEKTDEQGKLLPEMILICQNLRNNLQHPNEFLRGVTLRFLCRITEQDLLEPLIPSIIACLEHRHSFVRRNAVMAIDRIYQLPGGDIMLQDAPETIERFLSGGESDLSTRRNHDGRGRDVFAGFINPHNLVVFLSVRSGLTFVRPDRAQKCLTL